MTELGRISKVDLREIWKHEATDFSAWLSREENLLLLSEELGLDIEIIGTEQSSGRFRIDILAKETNSDHYVIIENQLESTNHDHLGKVITYASGFDAKYLVWIVREVLPEHQKAIEWLNDHLDEEINCFLVKVEVWKIGDSVPAPRFEVICQKNNWAATLRSNKGQPVVTETKLKQLDFWTKFVDYAARRDPKLSLHKPSPHHWLNFSIGTSGAHVAAVMNSKENSFGCDFTLKNKSLFPLLKDKEALIRQDLNREFIWWEADKSCGARTKIHVGDIFDESKYQEYFEMIYQLVIDYRKVFMKYLKESKAVD